MKKRSLQEPTRPPQLIRNRAVFEFVVRSPHGSAAMSGYRRAARHFGLHTMEDPSFEGSDAFRMFVHQNARKLRAAAKVLTKAYTNGDDEIVADAETWLACESDVHWFTQDWRWWDETADEDALKYLGWKRRIHERTDKSGNQIFRVTLRKSRLRH